MFAVYNLIIMPIGFVCIPYFFNVTLEASAFQLSLATGSIFLGLMIASLLVPIFLKRYRLRSALMGGWLPFASSQLVWVLVLFPLLRPCFDTWRIAYLMSSISFGMGMAITFFNIPVTVIFQRSCYRRIPWQVLGLLLLDQLGRDPGRLHHGRTHPPKSPNDPHLRFLGDTVFAARPLGRQPEGNPGALGTGAGATDRALENNALRVGLPAQCRVEGQNPNYSRFGRGCL